MDSNNSGVNEDKKKGHRWFLWIGNQNWVIEMYIGNEGEEIKNVKFGRNLVYEWNLRYEISD